MKDGATVRYGRKPGIDSHWHEQQGALENVTFPEGAGPGPKPAASPPRRVQITMLRTSRESSDSDEEPEHERTYLAGRTQASGATSKESPSQDA